MRNMNKKNGFTLIELLIVVAILAILAAIGIYNYMGVQTKAKVACAKSEMRTIATALEAYYNDNNAYPRWVEVAQQIPLLSQRLNPLTTPVSSLTNIPSPEIFQPEYTFQEDGAIAYIGKVYDSYSYMDAQSSVDVYGESDENIGSSLYGRMCRLASSGPDRIQNHGRTDFCGCSGIEYGFYDPSNGIVSNGDIVRLGQSSNYYRKYAIDFDPQ